MLPTYKKTHAYYNTGNTKIYIYRRKKENRHIKHLLANNCYYLKQKLSGLTMATIGILTPICCDGDATFSLIALPLGIYLLFTKNKVMMF